MKRKPYPSDVTDEQWAIIEPLLPPIAQRGRPPELDRREVLNALFYLNREGITWRAMPHDLPNWSSVYNYFHAWRDDGTWKKILQALNIGVRRKELRADSPNAAVIDSQTVKVTEQADSRGYDGGKNVTGRKRHILVDTLGLLLAVVVTVASCDDAKAAPRVLGQLDRQSHPRLEKIWADGKYHNRALYDWLEDHSEGDWELEIQRRPADKKHVFAVVKWRWLVERTFAWIYRYRRHSKDYERLSRSSESMIQVSMVHRCLQKLAPKKKKRTQRFRYKKRRKKAV